MANIKISDGAWVSPHGDVITVSFCRHTQTAMDILSALGHNSVSENNAEKELCSLGYLHIGLNYINSRYNDITDNQVNAIYQIMKSCDVSLASFIEKWLHS